MRTAANTRKVAKVTQFVDTLISVGVVELNKALPTAPVEQLREAMTAIAHEMCFLYARTDMYVPANLQLPRSERNARIWQQHGEDRGQHCSRPFTAERIADLAAENSLTPRMIQSILASERARERTDREDANSKAPA